MGKREMVKWQPFNAVAPGSFMINEVLQEKNKIKMPILSDDQKQLLQDKALDSFQNQDDVTIIYFKNGKLFKVTGIISNMLSQERKLVINGKVVIYFSQIVKIC